MKQKTTEECGHNCAGCGEECSERSLLVSPHPQSKIKKIIGVMSGKGGVGKSLVTSLLAVETAKQGKKTAILDADITGPSIPRTFGIKGGIKGGEEGIYPRETKLGIKLISSNLLLPDETDPVVWRGPMIANMVKQFWTEVVWGEVDYMFVDMPPGTGDVPLTVFQSLPVDGIVIVTSPQELVSMIVSKAVNMARMMGVPILGVVENMSYVKCPDCGKEIPVFGESRLEETAARSGVRVLGRVPLDPEIARLCDAGRAGDIEAPWLRDAAAAVRKTPKRKI